MRAPVAGEGVTGSREPLPQGVVGLAVDALDRPPFVHDGLEPVARRLPLGRCREFLGLGAEPFLGRDGVRAGLRTGDGCPGDRRVGRADDGLEAGRGGVKVADRRQRVDGFAQRGGLLLGLPGITGPTRQPRLQQGDLGREVVELDPEVSEAGLGVPGLPVARSPARRRRSGHTRCRRRRSVPTDAGRPARPWVPRPSWSVPPAVRLWDVASAHPDVRRGRVVPGSLDVPALPITARKPRLAAGRSQRRLGRMPARPPDWQPRAGPQNGPAQFQRRQERMPARPRDCPLPARPPKRRARALRPTNRVSRTRSSRAAVGSVTRPWPLPGTRPTVAGRRRPQR